MRQLLTTILLVLFAAHTSLAAANQITRADVERSLQRLDRELAHRDEYLSRKMERIDSIKNLRHDVRPGTDKWFSSTMQIADEYISINNDSVVNYLHNGYDSAIKASNDSLATAFLLKISTYMPLYGIIDDSITQYEEINPDSLGDDLKSLYYESGRQMFSYASAFYWKYPDLAAHLLNRSVDAQRNLLDLLPEESVAYRLNRSESLIYDHRYDAAKQILLPLIEELPTESNAYARACHFMADIATYEGDHLGQIYYLTQSAISDAIAPTLEVVSLQELGQILFKEGDLDRSYKYLSVALSNAVECSAILRQIETSRSLPVIQQANQAKEHQWRKLVYIIIAVLILLACILVAVLIYLRTQMRRLTVMQINLQKAARTRDTYINQFMTLCTTYIEKLKNFNRTVSHKLSVGKTEELYAAVKSGKFVDEQIHEFYDVFDDAFLHIYPTFVSDVNALLQPDKQIVLHDGEQFNTDLRILAFMRLGIEDSQRIAQILNYSVNTIYTYRNKLRNRAINRDTFEQDLMRTPSV